MKKMRKKKTGLVLMNCERCGDDLTVLVNGKMETVRKEFPTICRNCSTQEKEYEMLLGQGSWWRVGGYR